MLSQISYRGCYPNLRPEIHHDGGWLCQVLRCCFNCGAPGQELCLQGRRGLAIVSIGGLRRQAVFKLLVLSLILVWF